MKKSIILFSILTAAVGLVSCNKIEDQNGGEGGQQNLLPQTEVFFQGQKLFYNGETRPEESRARIKIMNPAGGLAWPKHTDEGWESARFSIRADGTIPDFYDKSSTYYYGRPAGKAGVSSHNVGKVASMYNYAHYNDRDLDYYKGQ